MSAFSKKQLRRYQVAGVGLALVALVIAAIVSPAPDHEESFWAMYKIGLYGVSVVLIVVGIVWAAMAAVHEYTDFFDTRRSIGPDAFMVQVISIAVCAIILIAVLVPRVKDTPPEELPGDNEARIVIKEQERNFKFMVSGFILLSAIAVGYFPTRRFLRK